MNKPEIGLTTTAHFIRVVDADTIEVEVRRKMQVRVKDLLCEEKNKDAGKIAKEFAKTVFLPDETLTLFIPTYGESLLDRRTFSFNRLVGNIWLSDGRNYGDVIVGANMGRYLNPREKPHEGIWVI
jgi:endonuclease YncB( thermonuclease family)